MADTEFETLEGFTPEAVLDGAHIVLRALKCDNCGVTITGEGNLPETAEEDAVRLAKLHTCS